MFLLYCLLDRDNKMCKDIHLIIFNYYFSFLKEIDEDLFTLPRNISLAHCVAEDLRMGAGIAVNFK